MRDIRVLLSLVLFLAGTALPATGQAPPGYYSAAQGLTGASLRNALHNIIDNHTVIPYSGSSFDTVSYNRFFTRNPGGRFYRSPTDTRSGSNKFIGGVARGP